MLVRYRGVLFVAIAAVLYSTAGLCMKFIPWGGIALNGARSMVALGVYALFLLATHHKLKWNRWIFVGAMAICATNLLFAMANKMTTAANSIVLQYTSPIFVILISVLFLHKRIQRIDVLACITVMSGVLCFFLESLGGGHIMGDLIALLSGFTYAVVFFMQDMPDGDPMSSLFWGTVISIIVGLPFLSGQPALDAKAIVSVLFLGAFQMGLAFIFLLIGLRSVEPITASLISGIEPVLNPTLVAVFYGEYMGVLSLTGAAIVICGVVGYQVLLGLRTKRNAMQEMSNQINQIDK